MLRLMTAAAAVMFVVAPAAAQTTTDQYGDVQVTNAGPGGSSVFQLTSTGLNPGYGGIYFDYGTPITLASITQLSSNYQMTQGTFGGGSPRFTLLDTSGNSQAAYVYFGTPTGTGTFTDPTAGSFANTGNYANLTSGDARVEINGFGGFSTNTGFITWAAFVAQAGSTNVRYITLDVDGAYGSTSSQQAIVNNFRVNADVLNPASGAVPEPATWAMMMLGFGGMGYAMRRNAKVSTRIRLA